MKAILLAAGRGSRMKDLTDDRPKCLVEIHGKPLLEWQRAALKEAGIDEIGIVTGYRREMLANRGMREFNNPRWEQTNMVTSLACAQDWLENEPCIVSYSDIFYSADAVRTLMRSDAALAITYDPDWRQLWEKRFADPLLDAETFRLNPDGTLAEIGSQPQTLGEIEGQYMGLLRISPAAWAEIRRIRTALPQEWQDRMHMTGTLQRVIEAGRIPIVPLPYRGEWGEVDSAEDLLAYRSTHEG
ncbi:MAG: putative sugar nucleotidyltransferase [Rhodocyclaceae bacterium]|nr:putative sugar nucleotidyltransferase [Rhodocyclaceae bacterium]